jgi:two-component system chemotaxis sensor kinase CheA
MNELEKTIQEAAENLVWPKSIKEKLLEKIAAHLIMVMPDDLSELAEIHEMFQEMVTAISNDESPESMAAVKCADFVEKIILREVDDPEETLSMLKDAVTALQGLIRDRRNLDEVEFPDAVNPVPKKSACKKKPAKKQAKKATKVKTTKSSSKRTKTKSKKTESKKTETVKDTPENDALGDLVVNLKDSDVEIIAEFINEAREHCTSSEELLMKLEDDAGNKEAIDGIFRGFHTIKGAAGFLELKPISILAHESETLLDMGRKDEIRIEGKVADLIFDAIDKMRTLLTGIEKALSDGKPYDGTEIIRELIGELQEVIADPESALDDSPKLGEVLVDMGAVSESDIQDALTEQKKAPDTRLGETLIQKGKISPQAVEHALKDQQRSIMERTATVKEMVKIDTDRLDRLVDTIGELVIAESMVGQDEEILSVASTKMTKNISHLNKITRELQEMGMAMRLVPVKAAFQKLARAVRDLSRRSRKKVNLTLVGEDSEVDRSIVEYIGDPLMHMARNSIDHGLETAEERIAAGKPETGNIWVRAFHKGGNIHFEIEDDGRGLDKKKILAKAKEKGLFSGSRELSDSEIYSFILHPGFSTAAKVTDISGRGVGMDVVKKNIEAMRGHLEISSEFGKGTKITMQLPLTLAIIDGMLVSVGDEEYIIPTLSVVESLRLSDDLISTISDKYEMINLRGDMMPLFRVRDLFNLPYSGDGDSDSTVVVIDDMKQQVGLVIDKLLGQRQIVIKSLGSVFRSQKWISGGAILSDGSIGLIIDVAGIINLAHSTDSYSRRSQEIQKNTDVNSESADAEKSEIGENEDNAVLKKNDLDNNAISEDDKIDEMAVISE